MKLSKNLTRAIFGIVLSGLVVSGCQKASKTTTSKTSDKTSLFASSADGLTGSLKNNFVPFYFRFPKSWVLDTSSSQPGSNNFVRVERHQAGKEGKFTLENFAVGFFHGTGTPHGDKELMPKVAKRLEQKFAHGFDNYELISQGPTKIGEYQGYGFRFISRVKNSPKGPITLWGRTVFLPNPKKGKKNGVTLMMMGSSLAPKIKSASDVGVKGQLPTILKSFRFGTPKADQ